MFLGSFTSKGVIQTSVYYIFQFWKSYALPTLMFMRMRIAGQAWLCWSSSGMRNGLEMSADGFLTLLNTTAGTIG